MSDSIKELVIKAKRDDCAKLQVVRSFEPLVKKCIGIYLKDRSYFDDAMQEGKMVILYCIENYDVNSNFPFEAYVKRAVIYGIRNFSKRIKDYISLDEEITEEGGTLHDVIESDVDIEESEIKKETLERLKDAIRRLSDKQRDIIEKYYFKNMSMIEICSRRRCHYMAVVNLKDRAIKRLREELGD